MIVTIAADYGGRWDITQAAKQLAVLATAGKLDPDTIDEAMMQKHIALSDLPAPDLCIRTGGEFRISNFLLWQLAYTELHFTPTFWPVKSTPPFGQRPVCQLEPWKVSPPGKAGSLATDSTPVAMTQ